jgi:Skp family chaperone for outer membrane proteins
MKKILFTTAFALSAVTLVFAQGTTTPQVNSTTTASTTMPEALPPIVLTGDAKADNQIRALRKEMETKIKAIREEYQKKLKALVTAGVAAKKAANASSTKTNNGKNPEVLGTTSAQVHVLNNNGATTTKAAPKGNAWGFLLRFFGQLKPVASSTQ